MTAGRDAGGLLASLIRTESTPGQERQIIELVVAAMNALGYEGVHVDAAGNALGWIGSGSPTVLVDCHVDTVPVHSAADWTHPPFAAEVTAGRMFGLGACDMKASVAAALHGLARLQGRVPGTGTVILVCSVAEEMMEGAALRAAVESTRPDMVVVGEPTNLAIHRGQRGRAKIDLTVHGRGAHVAHRSVGANAIEGMAAVLSELTAAGREDRDPATVFACLDITSEPQPSISMVPHLCHAHLDCRFDATVEPDRLLDRLDAIVGAVGGGGISVERALHVTRFDTYAGQRFAVPELVPAWELAADHPAVRAALAGASRAGVAPTLGTYGFCTNGGMTAGELGIPTIGFGPGRESDAHTVDESVSLADVDQAVRGFGTIVEALLHLPVGGRETAAAGR